jgi:hypothetical protein
LRIAARAQWPLETLQPPKNSLQIQDTSTTS